MGGSNEVVEKVNFISGCPGIGCDNFRIPYEWSHKNCGGTEWLDEKGFVICKKCGIKDILLNWRFKCEGHADYKEVNTERICYILSISSSLETGNRVFKKNLLKAVSDMI